MVPASPLYRGPTVFCGFYEKGVKTSPCLYTLFLCQSDALQSMTTEDERDNPYPQPLGETASQPALCVCVGGRIQCNTQHACRCWQRRFELSGHRISFKTRERGCFAPCLIPVLVWNRTSTCMDWGQYLYGMWPVPVWNRANTCMECGQ